jgi:hypothetical protein
LSQPVTGAGVNDRADQQASEGRDGKWFFHGNSDDAAKTALTPEVLCMFSRVTNRMCGGSREHLDKGVVLPWNQ